MLKRRVDRPQRLPAQRNASPRACQCSRCDLDVGLQSASAGIVAFSNITTRTCKSAPRIVVDAQHSPDGPRGSRRPRNSASAPARAGPCTHLQVDLRAQHDFTAPIGPLLEYAGTPHKKMYCDRYNRLHSDNSPRPDSATGANKVCERKRQEQRNTTRTHAV